MTNKFLDIFNIYNIKKNIIIVYNDNNNIYNNINKKINLSIFNFFVFDKPEFNIIIEKIPVELQLYCNIGTKYYDINKLTKKISLNVLESGVLLQYNNFNINCNLLHASILFTISKMISDNIINNNMVNYIKNVLIVKNNNIFNDHLKQLINSGIVIDDNDKLSINNIDKDINLVNIPDKNIIIKVDKNIINNIELNRETIIDCYIIKILKESFIINNKLYIDKNNLFEKLVIKLNNIFILDNIDLFNKRLNKLIDNIYIEKHTSNDSYIYID